MQVYPDTGVAAMLKNSWTDCSYKISSLIDRRPVDDEDEVIIIAAPDPLGDFLVIICLCLSEREGRGGGG